MQQILTGAPLTAYNNLPATPPDTPLGDLLNRLANASRTVYKTVDESLASSNVLQPDNELFLDLDANKVYEIDAILFMTLTADGLQVAFNGNNGFSDLKCQAMVYDNQLRAIARLVAYGVAVSHTAAGPGDHWVRMQGSIAVTTAGRLTIWWAQQTVNVAPLVLQKGSYFRCTPLT
jgi:hypothetical protein